MFNLSVPSRFLLVAVSLIAPLNVSAANIYITTLSGSNEVPPTGSAATGTAMVTLSGDTLTVAETFSGLTVPATAAHIHCCGPLGVNEPVAVPFPNFPTATSGTYSRSFDLTLAATYNAPFLSTFASVSAAESALVAALNNGQTYANIHNPSFPGGEIRGQLALQPVPEPSTGAFLFGGLIFTVGLACYRAAASSV